MPKIVLTGWLLFVLAAPTSSAHAQSVPSVLPSHFAFGLEAGQGDTWLPQSGIAWDYRWQYLAGGVNTNQGWETWNPNGTFPLNYANEADQYGHIPMFPYYEIFHSNGDCSRCNENQKDLSNLNNRDTMRAYYQNFALLMKRLGPGTYDGIKGFGKTALINVEPDFSGGYTVQAVNNGVCFGFCTARGNDPALLKAVVGSSGVPELAGYADTYIGFTQALAHLRDLYAPNVLLGYDVSPWATGIDIGADTNPNLDAAGMGQQVGAFMSKTGAHEVLWNDPLDRDAGQYKTVFKQSRWWDRLNVTYPNFARWEQFLHAAVVADNNKPMLLWQVPVGNQYFQSENNTDGHFQDNRAEYIFGHIPELIQSGVIAALFGPGNAGNTTYSDAKGDGVTNPPPFCTTDGVSSGQICNDHPSTVADNDGGYIRMMGQAYYQNPVPLRGAAVGVTLTPTLTLAPSPTVTPTSTPASASTPVPASAPAATLGLQASLARSVVDPDSAAVGQDVTLQTAVTVTLDTTLLIDFEVWDSQDQKVWQTWHDNQPLHAGIDNVDSAVFTVPDDLPPGQYRFAAGVFSAGWGTLYAWDDHAGALTIVD